MHSDITYTSLHQCSLLALAKVPGVDITLIVIVGMLNLKQKLHCCYSYHYLLASIYIIIRYIIISNYKNSLINNKKEVAIVATIIITCDNLNY